MRKFLVLVTGLALISAACGEGGSDGTTTSGAPNGGQTNPTTTDDGTTTSEAQTGELEYRCTDTDPLQNLAGDVMCAVYHTVETAPAGAGPQIDDYVSTLNLEYTSLISDFKCLYMPGQVFVFPAFPVGGEPAGLVRAADELDGYMQQVGVGLYSIVDNNNEIDVGADVFDEISQIEDGGERAASPHYLFAPVQTWKFGPGGEPVDIPGFAWSDVEAVANPQSEGGRPIRVVDTGASPFTGLGVTPNSVAEPVLFDDSIRGHGQFVASVISQYNSALQVDVLAATDLNGLTSEATVMATLQGLTPQHVVNLSLGTYPCSDADPPLGISVALTILPHEVDAALEGIPEGEQIQTQTAIVAASGNDGEDVAMYPARLGMETPDFLLDAISQTDVIGEFGLTAETFAAYAEVVGGRVTAVGALERAESLSNGYVEAWWSNPAEVYVPGEGVVGMRDVADGGQMAVWSGTSFAAPRFAACVASSECVMR